MRLAVESCFFVFIVKFSVSSVYFVSCIGFNVKGWYWYCRRKMMREDNFSSYVQVIVILCFVIYLPHSSIQRAFCVIFFFSKKALF